MPNAHEYTPRAYLTPSASLVENGKFHFGTFSSAFQAVNPLDSSQAYALPLPDFLLNLRLKEWQAFQVGTREYFMMPVVYNAKGAALVKFVFYDRAAKQLTVYEKQVMPWEVEIAQGLWGTQSSYRSPDFTVVVRNDLENGRFRVEVDIRSFQGMEDVTGFFEGYFDAQQIDPMVVSLPFENNRGMYSHKCLMPMQGELQIGNRQLHFRDSVSFMMMDDHKGFYPYIMQYDWVTAMGFTPSNSLIGFNLTDNQVKNQEAYNENGLWIDGKLHLLPPVKMERPDGVMGEWSVTDEKYDRVNLAFFPEAEAKVDLNYLVAESRYRGLYGHFTGYIRDTDGEKVEIDHLFGMGEKMFLRV